MKLIPIEEIVDAKLRHDWPALNEASLGRVYQHFQRGGHKSWAILTSWRSDADHETNKQNFRALQHDVRGLGHGYNRMVGHGQEEDPATKETIVSKEPSLFIHGVSHDNALSLAKKYNQFSVIYSGPETQGKVHLVHTATGEHHDLGDFHPGKIAQFYSRIQTRHGTQKNFTFESYAFEYIPTDIGEAQWKALYERAKAV